MHQSITGPSLPNAGPELCFAVQKNSMIRTPGRLHPPTSREMLAGEPWTCGPMEHGNG